MPVTVADWRDNPRITILTSAQVESLDRKRIEIGREKDETKRAKLVEAYEIWQAIYATRTDQSSHGRASDTEGSAS